MSQELEFFTARAEEAAAEARNATLDNVRDRALRSEAAWRTMANRRAGIEDSRRKAEATKAAIAEHEAARIAQAEASAGDSAQG